MKAEIISIGTELLLGEIVDTNTPYLADQLALLGIDLYFTSSTGDNYERLSGALKQAWQRSDLIITTGGLGPTGDDITREAIAGLLGEELQVDPGLKQSLIDFFARRGMEMTASNIKQASLIPSAQALANPRGTAPGWWVEKDGRIIIAMPGPPGEMQLMWQNEVCPRLQQRSGKTILSRTIKTFGLSESKVDDLVAALTASPNPTLATYAKQDGIHLRITAKAAQHAEAQEMISNCEARVRAILGDYIWGVDDETPEAVIGQMLAARGLSLAVAESLTSAFLTHTLASAHVSGNCFKGGLVAGSCEGEIALGLNPGVIDSGGSAEAAALAHLARHKLDVSIGVGISVKAGPDTEGDASMDTIFVAIEGEHDKQNMMANYPCRHFRVRKMAGYYALFDLWKFLKSQDNKNNSEKESEKWR